MIVISPRKRHRPVSRSAFCLIFLLSPSHSFLRALGCLLHSKRLRDLIRLPPEALSISAQDRIHEIAAETPLACPLANGQPLLSEQFPTFLRGNRRQCGRCQVSGRRDHLCLSLLLWTGQRNASQGLRAVVVHRERRLCKRIVVLYQWFTCLCRS